MNQESPENKQAAATNQTEKKSTRIKTWTRRGLEVLLFVVIIMGVRAWQQRDIVKGEAPPLIGIMLDGKPYVLPAKPGQATLVHFWATWCPVCRAEQGTIESLSKDNPNVVTIAMQSGASTAISKYMVEQEVSFPVVNDADNRISSQWGVQAVPASFIVDADGKIRFVEIGYTTGIGLRLRLWLASF